MMSSYKRIPKSLVKKVDEEMHISDRYSGQGEVFARNVYEGELSKMMGEIHKKEQAMLEEIKVKKESLIQQAYAEGFEKAKAEIREEIRLENEKAINEAKKIYMDANEYYKELVADSDRLKDHFLHEKKEEILDLSIRIAENITHQLVESNDNVLKEMFRMTVERIPYETKKLYVRLNPKTKELVKNLELLELDERIVLLPDISLKQTDFVVETEREFIDASMAEKLDKLRQSLRSVLHD